MKKILLLSLFVSGFGYCQSLQEVFTKYIQPSSTAQELREGIDKLETICSTNPQEKCNKAKAMAYYLLANNYYSAAYTTKGIDDELAQPIVVKANELFQKGNSYMAIDNFPAEQRNLLLENKNRFDSKFQK